MIDPVDLPDNPIFCAIDTGDFDKAQALVSRIAPHIGGIKLGLEFFSAHGPAGVRSLSAKGLPVFLDVKLHDIPNTVAGAVRALAPLQPALITIHAPGGCLMGESAVEAAGDAAAALGVPRSRIVGVTVLTSLDGNDLADVGVKDSAEVQVLRLAELAARAGLDGLVCSPKELPAVRAAHPHPFLTVVPGVRPAGAALDDQKRVMTPADGVRAGADILVVGRPITGAPDPVAAARAIAEEVATTRADAS